MNELDPVHIDSSHPCVPCYEKLLIDRDQLKAKLEACEGRLNKAVEALGRISHPESLPLSDDDCLAKSMKNIAAKALEELKDA